jgi:protein TonB
MHFPTVAPQPPWPVQRNRCAQPAPPPTTAACRCAGDHACRFGTRTGRRADRSGRQRNDYLSRVFRHLEPYRVSARAARGTQQRGRVVTRVTIRRDGGLIDVRIDSSSGWPAVDATELEAIRNGAPFPPVPANMPGDPVILILRMTY